MIKNAAKRFYLILIFILLYSPIVTLMVLSFNSSKTRSKWGGFTGKWYTALFQNRDIMNALYTTLIIALVSALIATIIGTAAAIGIQAMKPKFRTFFMGVTNIPMLNADIVTGISLMLLFIAFRFSLGFKTILLAHITFNIPYVILSVMPKLKQTSKHTYEAALDLGASPVYAFFKVVFPDIMPGVFSGFLLAFTMSLDDFVITHFTKGPGVDTLSTKIYSEVRKGIKPEMYALSTIMFVTVLVLLFLVNVTPDRKETAGEKRLRIQKKHKVSRLIFRKVLPTAMVIVIIAGGFFYGSQNSASGGNQVIVYNWGEYLDPEVITMFEEETGIDVVYEEYETNEIIDRRYSSHNAACNYPELFHTLLFSAFLFPRLLIFFLWLFLLEDVFELYLLIFLLKIIVFLVVIIIIPAAVCIVCRILLCGGTDLDHIRNHLGSGYIPGLLRLPPAGISAGRLFLRFLFLLFFIEEVVLIIFIYLIVQKIILGCFIDLILVVFLFFFFIFWVNAV